jgi:hypothetical protein
LDFIIFRLSILNTQERKGRLKKRKENKGTRESMD